jgi:hypothetical protein
MTRALRWGDHDCYFGPFTWSYSASYPHWSITISSRSGGDGDSWDGGSALYIHLGKATLIVALPGIIRPWRQKRYPGWDAETINRLGRDWYWDVDHRKYGFSYSDGFLQVFYGRTGGACMDSRLQQQWSCFLPWTQWRHVRHSLYGLDGAHFWTEPANVAPTLGNPASWEAYRDAKEACPRAIFAFDDHDGQRLTATTRIEEREWHFGAGWFKWLSWFRRPKIARSLDIEFSDETGRDKGSWKGGVIGTSIEMLPGELHEAAFRRFCDQEHRSKHGRYRITFVGEAR